MRESSRGLLALAAISYSVMLIGAVTHSLAIFSQRIPLSAVWLFLVSILTWIAMIALMLAAIAGALGHVRTAVTSGAVGISLASIQVFALEESTLCLLGFSVLSQESCSRSSLGSVEDSQSHTLLSHFCS